MNLEDYLGDYGEGQDERWRISASGDIVIRIAQDIAKHVDRLRDEWS